VIEDRNNGHSAIALESVLSRTGRYVSFVYWPESGIGMLVGGLGRIAVGETGGGTPDRDEADRYCGGICVFSNGNSECSSVKSRVVEYLKDSHCKLQSKVRFGGEEEGLTRNGVFRGSEAHIISVYVNNDECVFKSSP